MYISVDMGGTNTRVTGMRGLETLAPASDALRHRNTQDYEQDLRFIIDAARRIAGREAIKAVGIGTPGTPSPDRSSIATAVNLPHWNGQPLVAPLADALQCPVYFDNDAVTAGLGEAYYGNAEGQNFHYLIWGTGIGGADVKFDSDGDVVHAAKIHWKNHLRDWTLASGGKAVTDRYGQIPSELPEHQWRDVMDSFQQHLLAHIRQFQPESIIFGGGLANLHGDELVAFGEQHGTKIKMSAFGDDSGVPGGFGLIRYASRHELPPIDQTDVED